MIAPRAVKCPYSSMPRLLLGHKATRCALKAALDAKLAPWGLGGPARGLLYEAADLDGIQASIKLFFSSNYCDSDVIQIETYGQLAVCSP
jgi:hypothetical protein